MSDTKEIKETEVKEATFAILPPQLQVSETLLNKVFRIFFIYTGTNTGQI